MKHKRSLFTLVAVLLLALAVFPGAALAADTMSMEQTPDAPSLAAVYPAEVRTSEENGVIRLERIYYLSTHDDPSAIPTEDFDREGQHFTLLDVLKTDLSETDTKDYIEVVTLESDTKDMGEIIKTLEPELAVVTEDGYSGVLKPDYANINVEATGYRTSSRTVSATRTYPNLSDADNAMIPKTVEENGRTLTLANVEWQEASTDYVDGAALAVRYNAVASYTGTATGRNVTGYTVTVDYGGEVTKTSTDTIIYTAVFSTGNAAHGETHLWTRNTDSGSAAKTIVALALGAILFLAIVGYGGRKVYRYLRDRKRGYK